MRILLVSWAWPPIGRIGSLRPLGFARQWTRLGHEVHVLTGPGDRGGEFAPDLNARAGATGAIVHRAQAPGIPDPQRTTPAFAMRVEDSIAPRSVSRMRQVVSQWRNFPDFQRSWIGPARALGRALHESGPFDVVWSTSPPESVHFVARALADSGLAWVADFRDAWSDYPLSRWDGLSRVVVDRITRRTLGSAYHVTAASEGIAASLRRAGGRPTSCVRNGFDDVAPAGLMVYPRTLGYFGRIDPQVQHPERLWPALRARRDARLPWVVKFFVTPGGGGGAAVRVPEDLSHLVSVHPPFPTRRPFARCSAWRDCWCWRGRPAVEMTVAGKIFEYVGAGRPVLVCAPPSFEARVLVEATGTGIGAWGDVGIAQALVALETLRPNVSGRNSLSREHGARQLLELFGTRPRLSRQRRML